MKYSYADQKFTEAIDGMAVSSKSIQRRVGDSYAYYLGLLKADQLLEDVQGDFQTLTREIESIDIREGEGLAAAMEGSVSDEKAVEIARLIASIWHRVTAERWS